MFQIGVAAGELMLSEPATTIGTQGRRVDTLQHEVLRLIDHISLRTGIATPKHIDEMVAMGGQRLDSGIGELLPAQRGMTICLMGADGERGVQQQHPLFCPARQIARGGDRCAEVCLNLLEDILQRWWARRSEESS